MKTTSILNRGFEHPTDGWYHIEAKGEHRNGAAGVVQVIDDESVHAIVNRFNADAEAGRLSHGHEMLIDHEHFKHDSDKETRAYGWLQKLANRADGIYGQIRWTKTGKDAVDGGDYRFFSTEYDPGDLKVLNSGAAKPLPHGRGSVARVRPMKLDGLTLTNDNNNKGQRPITNRAEESEIVGLLLNKEKSRYTNDDGTFKEMKGPGEDHSSAFGGCVLHMMHEKGHSEESAKKICGYIAAHVANRVPTAPVNPGGNKNERNKMKLVLTELGLSADASEESALTAVRTLKNRVTTAEEKTGRVTELETQNATLLDEQMDGLLSEYKVTDTKVINRLKPVLKPLKNRAERVACLDDFNFKAGGKTEETPETEETTKTGNGKGTGRVLNRGRGDAGRGQPTAEEQAEGKKATKIMNRARALVKDTPSLSLATAVKMAQDEEATT